MICKSCSAEYDDNVLTCPYCGSENKEAARELKEDILENYDREAEHIKTMAEQYPEKTARKWTKKIVCVAAILLALGIVLGMIAIVAGKLSVNVGYKSSQKHVERLEELFLAGDYAKIEEYLDKKGLYDVTYDKYTEVKRVYTYDSYMRNDMQFAEDILSGGMTDADKEEHLRIWCEDILKDASLAMEMSLEYSEDMQFLGNEDVLRDFYNETVSCLKDFGFSEEEIDRIEHMDKKNLPEDLVEKLFTYYWTQYR